MVGFTGSSSEVDESRELIGLIVHRAAKNPAQRWSTRLFVLALLDKGSCGDGGMLVQDIVHSEHFVSVDVSDLEN